jgi:hypothetical protein
MAVQLDPVFAPGFYVGCSAAVTLYVAARTLSDRCRLPHFAGLCAMAVVLVPDTQEVLLNVVNVQWLLAVGLILILISRDPTKVWEWTHDLIACIAVGLTGPFCIFLLPLYIWRALCRKTSASFTLALIVAACAFIQLFFVHRELVGRPSVPISWDSNVQFFGAMVGRRIGGSLMLGAFLPGKGSSDLWTALGAATLGLVSFLAFRPGNLRYERATMGFAFVVFVVAASVRTYSNLNLYFTDHAHSRYVFVPQLLTIFLLLAAAGKSDRWAKFFAIFAVCCFITNIPRLREPEYVDMQWQLYAPKIREGEAVTVPINPPGWEIHIPAR